MRCIRFAFLVLALFVAASSLVGCAASGTPETTASMPVPDLVYVAGRTTFIMVNTGGQGGSHVVAYAAPGEKICPACMESAEKYFKTGVMDSLVCKQCGATHSIAMAHFSK